MNARHTKLSNQFWSGFTPDARQPFEGYFVPHLVSRIAGVVLPVEMCEESEVSEVSPLIRGAPHRRGYVSSRISLMRGTDWAR